MAIVRPSIGGVTFISLSGIPETSAETIMEVTRKGQDGSIFVKDGSKTKAFATTTMVDVLSGNTLASVELSYKALVGTIVTVKTQNNQNYSNILVLDVVVDSIRDITTASGGVVNSPTILARATWQLQAMDV